MTWDGSALSFTVSAASGARNIEGMLPASFGGQTLSALTRNSSPVSYSIQTIKGVAYAVFSAPSGSYQASYAIDTVPPVISSVSASPASSTATITWTTNESATSRLDVRRQPGFAGHDGDRVRADDVTLGGARGPGRGQRRITIASRPQTKAATPPRPRRASGPATFTTGTPPNLNCPCSIWTPTQSPAQVTVDDTGAVEVGLKFRSTFDGFITGVRFYKSAQNIGTHVGDLWTSSGSLLATVTFANETGSGWQQATFSRPVAVSADTTYVVSYHTDTGFYSGDSGYFQTGGVTNGPLQALANGVDGPNGVYLYGSGGFPTNTYQSANYWVDVVFDNNIVIDVTPPTVTATSPAANATNVSGTAAVSATFSEDMDPSTITTAAFELRDASNRLVPATVSYDASTRTATLLPLGGLSDASTYTARVAGGIGAEDVAGNPVATDVAWSFTTAPPPPFTLTDTTFADFGAGTPGGGAAISKTADGEVILAPAAGSEFEGTTVPAGWSVATWAPGGAASFANGRAVVDGARISTDAMLAPGQSIEFVATFSTDTFEHVGLGITFNETPWAMFSTAGGGGLYARTNDGVTAIDTLIPGNWLGTPHRYRIDWTAASVAYSIDGVQVASHPLAIGVTMRPIISDYNYGNDGVSVDWLRATPYAVAGTFMSRVLDAGVSVAWNKAAWTATIPSGTTLALSARFGNTPAPDVSWTSFIDLSSNGVAISQTSQYVQYQASFAGIGADTPVLQDVTFAAPSLPTPSIAVSDVTVAEGSSGVTDAVFTLSLSHASPSQISVAYATADGTAIAGSDYSSTAGVAIFPAGTRTISVTVPAIGDLTVEPNETFVLNLSSPVNATIGDAQGVATIVNDDVAALSVGNTSVTEGDSGTVNAQFPVTLAAPGFQTITVSYATASGTATAGTDYTAVSGTLTFAPGVTSQTISVPVRGDLLSEGDETFTVNLSGATNATILVPQGVGTIVDNDPLPSLRVNNVTVTEGNTGTMNAVFTVTLSAASGRAVTVAYASADGTATAGADYTATSGALSFAPGETSQTVSVPVRGDTLDEANETYTLNLSSPTDATIAVAQGTGTITDDDATPTLAINNVSVTEGNSGTINAVFTVTMSAASGRTVTVNYATANGSATSPADYTATSGTLTIAAGATSQSITVLVKGDTLNEGDETFNVNLGGATNATISDSQGVGTIVDNDPLPSVTIGDASITEGNSGTKTLVFTLTLSAASGRTVTVHYATANGTATAGSDYTSNSGTVTFNAGTTTRTISITINGDRTRESDETFVINLGSPSNATLARTQAVGTILNDD